MGPAKARSHRRYPPGLAGDGPLRDRPVIRMPARAGTYAGFGEWVEGQNRRDDVLFHFLSDVVCIDLIPEQLMLYLPTSIFTYAGFRDWAASDAYPERGRISYLNGEVVLDLSPEEIETHNKVKEVVNRVIGGLVVDADLGQYYPDGVQVTNDPTGLDHVPDGVFVSWEALESGRARLAPRKRRRGEYVQLAGAPDWVLEVVSQTSVKKDTRDLPRIYCRSGIREYWLIDARGDEIEFRIFVRGRARYKAVAPRGGWLASPVFGRAFRLERRRDRLGLWKYALRVRPA
jgi:Uma2 family endonuclease